MLFATRMTHVTPGALLYHSNQHSQHPKKCNTEKLENKMEGGTEEIGRCIM